MLLVGLTTATSIKSESGNERYKDLGDLIYKAAYKSGVVKGEWEGEFAIYQYCIGYTEDDKFYHWTLSISSWCGDRVFNFCEVSVEGKDSEKIIDNHPWGLNQGYSNGVVIKDSIVHQFPELPKEKQEEYISIYDEAINSALRNLSDIINY